MNSPSRSIASSIKGRIWLAASGLAVVNCLIGLAAYLTLSFLFTDPFFPLFAAFILLTLTTLTFGWWLARDVLKPLEEVTLLARSLERSPSASLPRTTGAIETDQLLQTLHRGGQQLRNLISVMDDVAAGKVEAATIPLESSDKLSASFQKLVSKVTDSISAKRDLDELRAAIAQLANDTSKLRSGHLELAIRSEHPQTKELSDVFRFLSNRLAGLTQQIYASTSECERAAAEARSSLQSGLDSIDQRSLPLANVAISGDASKLDPLIGRLSDTVRRSTELYDNYAAQNANTSRAASASQELRAGVEETSRLLQKLRHRTSAVTQTARLAQDLARRTSLIALNASIASNGLTSPEVLAEEIENLSVRSDELHKQILLAGESLNSEIAGIEKELSSLSESAPDISRALNSSLQISHALFEQIANIGELEQQLGSASEEAKLESDKMKGVIEKLADVSLTSAMIRESESSVQRFSSLLESLRESVSDLRISGSPQPRPPVRQAMNVSPDIVATSDLRTVSIPTGPLNRMAAMPISTNATEAAQPTGPSGLETLIDMSAHFGEN